MNRNRCPVKPYPVKGLAACTPRNSGFGGNSGAGRNSHARNSHAAIAPGKAPERALGTFSGDFPASLRAPLRAPLRERLQSSSLVSSFLGARMRSAVSMLLLSAGLGLASPEVLRAAPEGGRVLQGEGEISYEEEGRRTVVRQSGSKLVVDWDRFDVGAEESVHFAQPGRESSVLNRIFDTKASEIYGRLTASGRVWLVNGHGVYFAPGARVNVGGLVASSLDVDPGEFMSGRYVLRRQAGAPSGRVVNRGLLEAARGGFVGLAGSEVSNEGLIYAQAGRIELATGERIEVVDFDGDGLLGFAVQEGVLAGSGKVENSGELRAQGGEVYLKGSVAREVLEGVVNNSGVIQASRVSRRGGKIVLEGVGGGVLNSGKLEVSGESGERGGEVKLSGDWVRQEGEVEASGEREGGRVALKAKGLLTVEGVLRAGSSKGKGGTLVLEGERVRLGGESELDVSGAIGGGRIYLGGGRQGQDAAIENARNTEVAEGAVLRADALVKGDGGEVIVWAEEKTSYQGSISARGGEEGGDGGFAEVSAKWLQYGGAVDLRAPRGKVGKLLLDPVNVRICNAGNTAVPCTHNNTNIFTGAAITTMLAGSNLEISTGATGTDPGNIALESDVVITWPSSARTLTLTAANDIILAGTLTGNSVATSTLDLNFGGTLDFSGLSDPGTNISNLTLQATGSGSGAGLKGLNAYAVTGVGSGVLPTGGGAAGAENWRFSGISSLEGTTGPDTFNINADISTGDHLSLLGAAGDDTFNVDANFKGEIFGGPGEDTFNINANLDLGEDAFLDILNGEEDNDTLNFGENGDVVVDSGNLTGGGGDDIFNVKGEITFSDGGGFRGAGGNDSLRVFDGAYINSRNAFSGDAGTDELRIMGDLPYTYRLFGDNSGLSPPPDAQGRNRPEMVIRGTEEIYGGSGADTFTYQAATNANKVDGGAGADTLEAIISTSVNPPTYTYTIGSDGNTLRVSTIDGMLAFSNIENLGGGGLADTFIIESGATHAGNLSGGAGDDIFNISGLLRGNIQGGAGNDQFNFLVTAGCLVLGSGVCGAGANGIGLIDGGEGSGDVVSVDFSDNPVKVTFLISPAVPGTNGFSGRIERVASGTETGFTTFTGINTINGHVDQTSKNELSVGAGLTLTHDMDNKQVLYSSDVSLGYSNFGIFNLTPPFAGLDLSDQTDPIIVVLTEVNAEGLFGGSYTIGSGSPINFRDSPVSGVRGGSGGDTLQFSIGGEVVTFTVLGDRQGILSVGATGQERTFTFESIENLVGSNTAADVFIFSEAGGLGTGGTVDGLNGADILRFSGASGVTYSTSTNGNTLMLSSTSTLLTGFSNVESLEGGSGADIFSIGTVLSVTLAGGEGADRFVFSGTGGVTSVDGGADSDTLSTTGNDAYRYTVNTVSNGGSSLERGSARVRVAAFSNIENLEGGDGADTFDIQASVEGLSGGRGEDIFIFGDAGFVRDSGGSVRTLDGGEDSDTLRVGGDLFYLYRILSTVNRIRRASSSFGGGAGGTLFALFRNVEVLEGGDGVDSFDIRAPYAGDLRGGAGADDFRFSGTGAVGNIDGGAGTDRLYAVGDSAHTYTVASGGNTLHRAGTQTPIASFSNVQNLGAEDRVGGTGVDTFNISVAHTGNLFGAAGNDIFTITGPLTGNIQGGAGDDQFDLQAAVTGNLFGAGGNDSFTISGSGSLTGNIQGDGGIIDGNAGNDIFTISGLVRGNIEGNAGDDQFNFGAVAGCLVSGSGICGAGASGAGSIDGGEGSDVVTVGFNDNPVKVTLSAAPEANGFSGSIERIGGGTPIEFTGFTGINTINGHTAQASANELSVAPGLDLSNDSSAKQISGGTPVQTLTYSNFDIFSGFGLDFSGLSDAVTVELTGVNTAGGFDGSYTIGGTTTNFVGTSSLQGGSGSDTLQFSIEENEIGIATFTVSGDRQGNLSVVAMGQEMSFTFESIENLVGSNAAADIFDFSAAGTLGTGGTVDGRSGTDTLRVTGDMAYTYTVASGGNTLARGATMIAAFSNVQNLEGGDGDDTFNINIAHTGILLGGRRSSDGFLRGIGSVKFNLAAELTGSLDGGFLGADILTLQPGGAVRRAPGGGSAPLVNQVRLVYQGWSDPVTVTLGGYDPHPDIGFTGMASGLLAADGSSLDASGFQTLFDLRVLNSTSTSTLQGFDLVSGQTAEFVLTAAETISNRGYFYNSPPGAVVEFRGRLSFLGIDTIQGGGGEGVDVVRSGGHLAENHIEVRGVGRGIFCEPSCVGSDPKTIWNFSRMDLLEGGEGVDTLALIVAAPTAVTSVTLGEMLRLPDTLGFDGKVEVASSSSDSEVWLEFREIDKVIVSSGKVQNILRNELVDAQGSRVRLEDRRGAAEGSGSIRYLRTGHAPQGLSYEGFNESQLFVRDLSQGSAVTVTLSGRDPEEGYSGTYSIGGGSESFTKSLGVRGTAMEDTLITQLTGESTWIIATEENSYSNGGSNGGPTYHFFEIENLQGGAGVDAFTIGAAHSGNLVGGAGDDTFQINAAVTGNVQGGEGADTFRIEAAHSGNLVGGAGDDTFRINAAVTGNVQGGEEADTIIFLSNAAVTGDVQGGEGADTFTIGAAHSGNLVGGAGNDIFQLNASVTGDVQGGAGADTFTIGAAHSGNLVGGAGDDIFQLNASVTGDVQGDEGADTFTIGAAHSGNLVGGAGNDIFEINAAVTGDVQGGAGADTFTLGSGGCVLSSGSSCSAANPTLGTISGGADQDSLSRSLATTYLLDATTAGAGTLEGIAEFSGIEKLEGGAASDTLSLTMIPATGENELVQVTLADTPTPDADGFSGRVSVAGEDRIEFEGVDVIEGNAANAARNSFKVGELRLSDRGNSVLYVDSGGTDRVLSYSNFGVVDGFLVGLTADVVRIVLTGLSTEGGAGMLYGSSSTPLRSFTNSPGVSGVDGGSHLLEVGFTVAVAGTFTISGADTGTYSRTSGGGEFSFARIGSLAGGAAAERFVLGTGGSLSGSVAGGEGVDRLVTEGAVAASFTLSAMGAGSLASGNRGFSFSGVEHLEGGSGANLLSYSGVSEAVTVTLQGRGALAGSQGQGTYLEGFTNISEVVGGDGTADRLVADLSGGGVFTLSGSGMGNYEDLLTFSAFENLSGGAGADTFRVEEGGSVSGELSGGGGNDVLDLSGVGSGLWLVELSGVTGAGATGFSGSYGQTTPSGRIGLDLVLPVDELDLEASNSFSFTGIDELIALEFNPSPAQATFLQGTNAGGRWRLNGQYAGSYESLGTTLSFSNVRQVQGGAGTDQVEAGVDILDVSAIAGPLTLFLSGDNGSLTTPDYRGNVVSGARDNGDENNTEPLVYYRGIERYAGGEAAYLLVEVLAEGRNLVVNPQSSTPAEDRPSNPILLSLTQDEGGERLQTLDEFLGAVLIGGTLLPAEVLEDGEGELPLSLSPSLEASVAVADRERGVQVNTLRVEGMLETRGDLYLVASSIQLAGDLAVGTETPGEFASAAGSASQAVLVAVGAKGVDAQAGDVPGDIEVQLSAGDTERTIYTGSGTLIADRGIAGANSLVLNFDGGVLRTAVSPGATRNSNPNPQSQVRPEGLTTLLRSYLTVLGLDAQEFVVILFNPTTQLSTVIGRLYLDLGLFVEELSLYGLEGAGLALFYSQCEEVEGCAPEATLEDLEELIAQLEEQLAGGFVSVTGLDREVLDLRLRRARTLRKELRLFLGLDAPEGEPEEEEELNFEEFDLPGANRGGNPSPAGEEAAPPSLEVQNREAEKLEARSTYKEAPQA